MIQEHGKRTDAQSEKLQEVFNKELECIETTRAEEYKNWNALEEIYSRINEAEKQ